MPLTNRYTNILQGGITSTGNTVAINNTNPNAFDVGAYTSVNSALQVAGKPPGTTLIASQNSSNAFLNIPVGSTVVYAELLWITPVNSNNAVNLSTPIQSNIAVSPIEGIGPVVNSYWRRAVVTNIINAGGGGFYTVGNVPGPNNPSGLGLPVSWTLIVAFKNTAFPYRYVTINTGSASISPGTADNYTITNFFTPSSGVVKGYLLMAYNIGDLGDLATLFVGPSLSNLTQLGNTGSTSQNWNGLAPYNPRGNMFSGYVCVADPLDSNIGLIDTRGTFGTRNVQGYNPPRYNTFSRVNYDLAGFDISNTLSNSQNSLVVQVNMTGGIASIMNESVQVDVNSPKLTPVQKFVDKTFGLKGENLKYTIVFSNTGSLEASNVVFKDTIPSGTQFVPNSVTVDNTPVSGNPQSGITLGTVAINKTTTITFNVVADSPTLPLTFPVNNQGVLNYNFVPGGTIPAINEVINSNIVTTTITSNTNLSTITKTVDKAFANVGDTLIYTVYIPNSGALTANNVLFIDTIPSGTSFIQNTFQLNGVTLPGINPQNTINIGQINPLNTTTITFKVKVNTTIPSTNPIPNFATTSYVDFIGVTTINDSNTVLTKVNNANLGNILKFTDKSYADCGDTITYTIVIPNTGNVTAQNVVFKDTIPNGTVLVPTTVSVNGIPQSGANPTTGITIPNIAPNTTATLNFQVIVRC